MRKILPLLIIAFVIISYIGCKSSNPVTPVTPNVTFKVTHFQNATHDTVFFGGQPSTNVKVTYLKGTGPSGDTASYTNLNFTWSKDTVYYLGLYTFPTGTGVYTFNFKGTVVSGGTAYNVTAKDSI